MISPLCKITKFSPNHSGKRTKTLSRITPHCTAGQISASNLGDWFSKESTKASSNYGIGKGGEIGCYVDEDNRSWCSSNSDNDNRAITIEVSSDNKAPYACSAEAWESLVNLCVDICKRYGKKRLVWLGDKDATLAYTPAADELVITVHRWFANKACPGEYIFGRLGELATTVTNRLAETEPEKPDAWAEQSCRKAIAAGIVNGYGGGRYGWREPITREQLCVILDRLGII